TASGRIAGVTKNWQTGVRAIGRGIDRKPSFVACCRFVTRLPWWEGAGEDPSDSFVSVRFRFSYLRTVSLPEATSRGEWVGIEPGRRFRIARRAFRARVEPQSSGRGRPPRVGPAAHRTCRPERGRHSHIRGLA